jgi:hypothetical protein
MQWQMRLGLDEYSREQQGLSLGHWLLALQEEAAQAVADRAKREVTKRTIVRVLFYVLWFGYVAGWVCAFE